MTVDELNTEIADIEKRITPLANRKASLMRERDQLIAKEWIAASRITKDDVQLSTNDGMPWFGHIVQFGEWLKKQRRRKLFAEWNGRIYYTDDIISGQIRDLPAMIKDLVR